MQKEFLVGFWENVSYLKIASSNRYKTRRRRRREEKKSALFRALFRLLQVLSPFASLLWKPCWLFFLSLFLGFSESVNFLGWVSFVWDLKLFARIGERRRRKVHKTSYHILDLSHPRHVCLHLFFFCWVLCKLVRALFVSQEETRFLFLSKKIKIQIKIKFKHDV